MSENELLTEVASISINPEIDTSDVVPFSHVDLNGALSTYREYPAVSFSSTSANFSIMPPSYNVFLNRSIMQITPITITLTGTTTNAPAFMLEQDGFALRSLVELRGLTTQSVTLNGLGYPVNTVFDTYPDIITHYSKFYRCHHPLGAPDTFTEYATGAAANNNALADYGTSTNAKGGQMRGAYWITSIVRTDTSAVIQFNVVSWLYIPDLFGLDCSQKTGLTRLTNMNVDETFSGDGSRWLSVMSGTTTVNSAVAVISGMPKIYCKFITPSVDMIPRGIISYPHKRWERFTTSMGGSLASTVSSQITTNNMQLGYIPRHCFIFVRESDTGMQNVNRTNTFCGLTQVSIMFNNQTALLSTAPVYELWSISRECGLLDTFQQFMGVAQNNFVNAGTIGSVFCAEFGRHISLGSAGLTVNSQGMFNFSAILTFTNNSSRAMLNPTAYVIFSYDQLLQCDASGRFTYAIPDINVAAAAGIGGSIVKVPYKTQGAGGNAGGNIKDFLNKAHNWGKDKKLLSRALRSLLPMMPVTGINSLSEPLANMAEEYGYGGKYMSDSEIRRRIKNL